ncbi:MAG: POTRA domain-containing protein, partial [Verrucomicrobiota bacterium]
MKRIFLLLKMGVLRRVTGAALGLFLLAGNLSGAETASPKLKISGYGLLGDLELKNLVRTFDDKHKGRTFYDANFIEDSALVLVSRLGRDGYLKPKIKVTLLLKSGGTLVREWGEEITEPLPRPTEAAKVEFHIEEGVFYFFNRIEIDGLTAMAPDDAEGFFVRRGALLKFKKMRTFTPAQWQRGLSGLTEVLMRKGYNEAQVTAEPVEQNDETGEVNIKIHIKEGPLFFVRSVREEFFYGTNATPGEVLTVVTNTVYSKLWQQDFAQALKNTNYHRGYPDTTVEMASEKREGTNGTVLLDLLAKVDSGEKITLGAVKFEGFQRTKKSVLRRRVRLKKNQELDRIKVDDARYRLAKLGVFKSVGVRYDQVDEHTRDVTYELEEGKQVDVSMLFGFGSYELLRVGFEVNQYNIFGRAHRARFRVAQSFKSTSADYLYTMPELIGEDMDVFFNAFGLRREEISFTREEYGGGAGTRKFLRSISSDFGVRYNY